MSLRIVEWTDFLENTACREPSAMTIGVFDGIHLGHRELIKRIVKRGPNPTIVTFRENPKKIVSRETYDGDIFSLNQKIEIFEQLGIRSLILIDFSENFSKLTGRDFLDLLEDQGKMVFLAIGSNFRCGHQTDTDAGEIAEINSRKRIPTELVAPVELPSAFGTGPVSSSRVRSAILSGDLKMAAALLGRNFELDLSDIKPAAVVWGERHGLAYDLRSVHRIVPAAGLYPVLLSPGSTKSAAYVEEGKVFLPELQSADSAEGIEFIMDY